MRPALSRSEKNMNNLPKKLMTPVLALILFAFGSLAVTAQTITATLSGEIKDVSGAVVPGATVTVTSSETGITKTTETNEDGRYTVTFLQPGTYRVAVAKTGFTETV